MLTYYLIVGVLLSVVELAMNPSLLKSHKSKLVIFLSIFLSVWTWPMYIIEACVIL